MREGAVHVRSVRYLGDNSRETVVYTSTDQGSFGFNRFGRHNDESNTFAPSITHHVVHASSTIAIT